MSDIDKRPIEPKSPFVVDPAVADSPGAHRCHLAMIREDDGTYSVIVLNLPGTGSCGDTEEEAMANVREAVRGVIETYAEDGEEIPWITDYEIPSGASLKWVLVDA
jgi:predicted RNase H-like HicB family nuclease